MEKMINNNRVGMFLVVGVMVLLMVSFVSAVAVSGTYSTRRPLEMYPGEIKSINFVLQNAVGDSDVKFKAVIIEGSDIVNIIDASNEYIVPAGTDNTPVRLNVVVPVSATIGTEYQVKINFEPSLTGEEDSGMVQILSGLSRYFTVKVTEKVEEEAPKKAITGITVMLILLIFVITLMALVILLLVVSLKKRIKKGRS